MADKAKKDDQLQKKKEDSSDRESSVESFHTNKSEFSTAAESELIDVDDIELSDEESWLYKSPKKLPSVDKTLNTYKWLNKDKDNLEVQDTKDALVRKLNQLQKRNDITEKHLTEENISLSKEVPDADNKSVSTDKSAPETNNSSFNTEVSKLCTGKIPSNVQDSESVKGKENDVLDVHRIAQLQEESLRQSTQRFLDLVEKRGRSDKNCFLKSKFSKPASVEALNVCNGKLDDEAAYTPLVPMQTLKKQNQFGSSSFLHQQDAHRGSLPNINPGYYSLRSKKSKKSLDQKLVCPLPLSPSPSRLPLNGAGFHASSSVSQSKLTSPLADYCESRTLPSSYRIHSRSNSSSRKDLNALSPSPRRESTPFLSHARSNSSIRRDSAPGSGSKYLSPMSSPTLYQRNTSSSPYLQSPTQPRRNPPKDLKTVPPNAENTSHSPSRRKPLSTVHNCSPKRANSPASPRKEDLKGCKLSSKIPSPGPSVRSGIPVPSSYSSRMASDDESWSHDCF
ncbi:SLAIN motif-containing protein 2-like [Argiope bruennichi]|uniref:SLAIN motif-containing protein 2-like n=1 Tax=Argiope bruennichi TaxID=94029 RepID=UPI0024954934|nr:SLAIN motif-containing protein 2-like [Argiope bruennichi]